MVDVGHPGHVPVAAGGKALVQPAPGAHYIGAGQGVGQLGGVGDDLVVLLRGGVHHPAEAHGPGQGGHDLHRPGGGVPGGDEVGGPHEDAGVAGGKAGRAACQIYGLYRVRRIRKKRECQ